MRHFLPFLLLLFLIAVVLRVDFFFTVLYFLLGVYVVLRLWARQVLANLQVERVFAGRAFPGDNVDVEVCIRNTGRWPVPWLFFNESLPWELAPSPFVRQVISLLPRQSHTFSYTLFARKRGYYQLGPLTITTGDLLGLQRRLMTQIEAEPLIVYPRVMPMSELGLPNHSPQLILPTRVPIFEDPTRLMGIRPYQWGDRPRHIHWPATANQNQVMLKQYQPAIARETMLMLDLGRPAYERKTRAQAIELAIVVAASLAHHVLTVEQQALGFQTRGLDPLQEAEAAFRLAPRRDQTQLMEILSFLARVAPTDQADFADSLRQGVLDLAWGATVVIISGSLSAELQQTLLWLQQAGYHPSLVLVQPYGRRVSSENVPCPMFEIWQDEDVKQWTRSA